MKRIILTLLVITLLTLITGCKEAVYQDSQSINGNEAEFLFVLDTSQPSYDVKIGYTYSYGLGIGTDKLNFELISPSGKKYTKFSLLSAKKTAQVGSTSTSKTFKDVQSEEGTFKLTIKKDGTKINLKKASIKIYETG